MNPYDPIVPVANGEHVLVVLVPSHHNHDETRMIGGHQPLRRLMDVVIHNIAEAVNHNCNPLVDNDELPPSFDEGADASTSQLTVPTSPSVSYRTDRVECELIARRKLMDWGFDPDDVSKASSEWYSSRLLEESNIRYCKRESRPMIIFSHLGDLPMMRYILKHSTLQDPIEELLRTDEHELFPLYTAISEPHTEEHILTVCHWLYAHGADIQQQVGHEWSCLSRACLLGYEGVAKWLLSSGALLTPAMTFDEQLAQRDLPPSYCYGPQGSLARRVADRVHRRIFAWARDICSIRTSFMVFLSGTILPTGQDPQKIIQGRLMSLGHYSERAASFLLKNLSKATMEEFLVLSASPLTLLTGHSGVLELIAQYVGVETSQKILRTVEGLVKHEEWWNSDEP